MFLIGVAFVLGFGSSLSFLLLQFSCLIEQLVVHKCNECGQVLPESFEPPADEPWTSGIFGCAEDKDSCTSSSLCYVHKACNHLHMLLITLSK